jgi:hypothetical protein
MRRSRCYWSNPPRSTIIDLKLPLCTVWAVDDDLFGFPLFEDSQVCAPTCRPELRSAELSALTTTRRRRKQTGASTQRGRTPALTP